MASMTQKFNAELKERCPDMGSKTRMNLAVALNAEEMGDHNKASKYSDKAIASEAKGE